MTPEERIKTAWAHSGDWPRYSDGQMYEVFRVPDKRGPPLLLRPDDSPPTASVSVIEFRREQLILKENGVVLGMAVRVWGRLGDVEIVVNGPPSDIRPSAPPLASGDDASLAADDLDKRP